MIIYFDISARIFKNIVLNKKGGVIHEIIFNDNKVYRGFLFSAPY